MRIKINGNFPINKAEEIITALNEVFTEDFNVIMNFEGLLLYTDGDLK